jgi:hypothetical protein
MLGGNGWPKSSIDIRSASARKAMRLRRATRMRQVTIAMSARKHIASTACVTGVVLTPMQVPSAAEASQHLIALGVLIL